MKNLSLGREIERDLSGRERERVGQERNRGQTRERKLEMREKNLPQRHQYQVMGPLFSIEEKKMSKAMRKDV